MGQRVRRLVHDAATRAPSPTSRPRHNPFHMKRLCIRQWGELAGNLGDTDRVQLTLLLGYDRFAHGHTANGSRASGYRGPSKRAWADSYMPRRTVSATSECLIRYRCSST